MLENRGSTAAQPLEVQPELLLNAASQISQIWGKNEGMRSPECAQTWLHQGGAAGESSCDPTVRALWRMKPEPKDVPQLVQGGIKAGSIPAPGIWQEGCTKSLIIKVLMKFKGKRRLTVGWEGETGLGEPAGEKHRT